MNDRLKELDEQIWAEEYWANPNTDKLLPAQLSKFAELIVRECADIDFYNLAGFDLHDHDRASQVIKEHFGVKE